MISLLPLLKYWNCCQFEVFVSKKQKFEQSRINQTSKIFNSLCKFCSRKQIVSVVIRDHKHKTSLLFTVLVMIIFEPSPLST